MTKRLAALLIILALAFGGWRLFVSLGRILHHEDTLATADAIFVLGGTRVERIAEAAALYREGWAPRILLSRQVSEPAEVHLRASGVQIPTETQLQRAVLEQMGVPPDAIDEVRSEQVATATEVEELGRAATTQRWSRVIVVTSKLHTARSRLAMRRHLAGRGTVVIMRASRYDTSDIDRWWANRSTLRAALFEAQKYLAYAVGIAD